MTTVTGRRRRERERAREREKKREEERGIARRRRERERARERDDDREPKKPAAPPPPPKPPKPPLEAPEYQLKPEERGFTRPEDSKVVERDAKGRPTVYETPDKVRHYTPQSVMWEKGYRTSTQYYAPGSEAFFDLPKFATTPPPFVAVDTPEGVRHVTRQEAIQLQEFKGEELFDEMKSLGLIAKDVEYIAPEMLEKAKVALSGYRKPDGTYDVAQAIEDKVTPAYLAAMFEDKQIGEVKAGLVKRQKAERLEEREKELIEIWQIASRIEPGLDWQIKGIQVLPQVGVRPPPVSPVGKFAEGGTLNLTEAIKAGHTHIVDYEGWNVTQSQIDKIAEEQKKRDDALQVLADGGYKGYGDSYRVVDALVSDDPKAIKALEVVFSEQDLSNAKKWIDRHWGAHGRFIAGKEIPLTKEVQKTLRKVTPWEEGKGETLLNYLQKYREQIPIPPSPLVALAVPVAVTPVPWDDLLLYSVIAGGAAFGLWKISDELKKTTATFRSRFERSPMPEDLVLVTSQGMAMGIKDIDPEKKRIPGVSIVPIDPKIPALFPRDLRQQIPGISIVKVDPKIPPISTKKVEPALYLPTPMITMDELTGLQAGMIKAVAGVAVAEEGLKKALPSTKTIPINWDKILAEAIEAKKKEEFDKAFATALAALPKVEPDISAHFTRNYQEYLRRRAILESAKKSYVASLNPTPVMGKISDEAVGVVASFLTSEALDLARPEVGEQLTPYLLRVLGPQLGRIAKTATSTAAKAFVKALAQGKTATQAATQTLTATQTAVQTQVRALTRAAALTKTQTRAITQTIARTATASAIRTAVARAAITPAAAIPATATLALIDVPPPPPLGPPIRLPKKDQTDKEKRKKIKKSKGAIAWRHGELHGKDVFHVGIYPYTSEENYFTVVGKKPEGATIVKGPGSARQSIKLLYGKAPPKAVRGDLGFFDFGITPTGPKQVDITFTPDPKMETTGDITIGRKTPPITERPAGLGRGKSPRITPKTPRLRR